METEEKWKGRKKCRKWRKQGGKFLEEEHEGGRKEEEEIKRKPEGGYRGGSPPWQKRETRNFTFVPFITRRETNTALRKQLIRSSDLIFAEDFNKAINTAISVACCWAGEVMLLNLFCI